MATLTLPFEAAEQNMVFVGSGVGVSEQMHAIRRFASQLLLTPAFYDAARVQSELIAMLENGCVEHLPADELLEIAARLDALVEKGEMVVLRANHVDFALWHKPVRVLDRQREKLESLAESFRMSASREFTGYVDRLVEEAGRTTQSTVDNWRDFVATLHD